MNSLYKIILVVSFTAGIVRTAYRKYQEREHSLLLENILKNLNKEELMRSFRKISFENLSTKDATLVLTLFTHDDEPCASEHILPAQESGCIPYFVSGILRITYNEQQLDIDIAQVKEYMITISPDHLLSYKS